MTAKEEHLSSLVGLLENIPSGRATVSVHGRPVISIDADRKALEVEAIGVADAGLHLSELFRLKEGRSAVLEEPMHVSGALSRLGWRLTLYAEGDKVLSMGRGVSRLTGRISVNPLKLKKLLTALG